MRKAIDRFVNVFMILCFLSIFYFFGAIVFGYDIPEFLKPKKRTAKEEKEFIENYKLRISVKEFKAIIAQRDSLKDELNKLKKQHEPN